jgi:hypothetical protein
MAILVPVNRNRGILTSLITSGHAAMVIWRLGQPFQQSNEAVQVDFGHNALACTYFGITIWTLINL